LGIEILGFGFWMVSFSPLDPVRYQWSHFNFYDGLGKFREVSQYVNTG
jgi:hypothetical protein